MSDPISKYKVRGHCHWEVTNGGNTFYADSYDKAMSLFNQVKKCDGYTRLYFIDPMRHHLARVYSKELEAAMV